MCHDRFSVFVNAQQIVRIGKCVSHSFLPIRGNGTKMRITIHATRRLNPRYVDEDGVNELGEMVVDLSSVMHKRLEDRSVEVSMFFGETELGVQAVVEGTQESLQATLELAPQDWE